MSKWISEAYIKMLMQTDRLLQGNCEYKLWEQEVEKIVDAMPSIDIVRCKECKRWSYSDLIESHNRCERTMKLTKADDFCSYGCNSSEKPNNSTISKMEQVDEPKTQMKTQNSNLTFKTLEYCDICDHKGCKECIANALDEHCMPSQFNKQIEDECAKEYEELGLKELKELIEADRKTEPQTERSE